MGIMRMQIIRLRTIFMRCTSNCRRSLSSIDGTRMRGKRPVSSSSRMCPASRGSVFCRRTLPGLLPAPPSTASDWLSPYPQRKYLASGSMRFHGTLIFAAQKRPPPSCPLAVHKKFRRRDLNIPRRKCWLRVRRLRAGVPDETRARNGSSAAVFPDKINSFHDIPND